MRLSRVLCVVLLAGTTACATIANEPKWAEPAVIPDGWVHDFDYSTSITNYLRQQFDSARLEGATGYVYIYDDFSTHCLATRRLMSQPVVADALREVRVTMLNYHRLKWLHTRTSGVAFDPGEWAPLFVKISIDGGFTDSQMYPDLYLFHPRMLADPKYGFANKPKRMSAALFAEELRKYFEANNEI